MCPGHKDVPRARRAPCNRRTGDRFLDKTGTTSNSELGCVAFTWAMVNVRHTVVSARCGRINTRSAVTAYCAKRIARPVSPMSPKGVLMCPEPDHTSLSVSFLMCPEPDHMICTCTCVTCMTCACLCRARSHVSVGLVVCVFSHLSLLLLRTPLT